jgi:hypothetical protein
MDAQATSGSTSLPLVAVLEQLMGATNAVPGTPAKIAVLAARLTAGEPLYHPGDARCQPLVKTGMFRKPPPGRKRLVIGEAVLAGVVADLRNHVPTRKVAAKYGLCRGVVVRIQREEIRGERSLRKERRPLRKERGWGFRDRPLDMPVLTIVPEGEWG